MRTAKPFFRPRLVSAPARDAEAEQARGVRELILPHMDGAYNFARYLTRDPVAAEDIVQEAFLRAFRAFPTWRGGEAKPWLFAIVRNSFLTWVGARQTSAAVLVHEDSEALANLPDPGGETPEIALLRQRDA